MSKKPVKQVTKKRKHREFREYVLEKLQDPTLALAYLNEALMDSDQRVFLAGGVTLDAGSPATPPSNVFRLRRMGGLQVISILRFFPVQNLQPMG